VPKVQNEVQNDGDAYGTTSPPEHASRIEDTSGERLARKLKKAQVPEAGRNPGREIYCYVE
jgi:hypothetical protein